MISNQFRNILGNLNDPIGYFVYWTAISTTGPNRQQNKVVLACPRYLFFVLDMKPEGNQSTSNFFYLFYCPYSPHLFFSSEIAKFCNVKYLSYDVQRQNE